MQLRVRYSVCQSDLEWIIATFEITLKPTVEPCFNEIAFTEVARNSFRYFPSLRFWWVILTTLANGWCQNYGMKKTVQSLGNMFRHIILALSLITQWRARLRPPLNFRKYNIALTPLFRFFHSLNVASYHADYKSIIKYKGRRVRFEW